MNCSMPGLPVLHYHLVFAQTHVHWVGDAIQSSHSLLPPSLLCAQSFSASWSFPKSQFFTSGGQSIRASASAPVLPMNIQGWFPLGLTSLISLQSKGFSRVFFNTTIQKASVLWRSSFFMVQLSHTYKTTGKNIALTRWSFVHKVMSLLCNNTLSRFVMAFLSRSKCLLISWLQYCPQWPWSPRK